MHVAVHGCILSKFYIKPQHFINARDRVSVVSYRNSTSNHNRRGRQYTKHSVVSYRNSTSNHNLRFIRAQRYFVVSYRNSTSNHNRPGVPDERPSVVSYRNSTSNHNLWTTKSASEMLYLIEILHQTTTEFSSLLTLRGCILSKFYIKPQLRLERELTRCVVSYRNSTSNHNETGRSSTSPIVVSYRNSTSNHNPVASIVLMSMLYLIEILHQTTTRLSACARASWLYLIEILHQTTTCGKCEDCLRRCILSKFYIKPQLFASALKHISVVSYRNSTSNHNISTRRIPVVMVVSYRNSTSNHNESSYEMNW